MRGPRLAEQFREWVKDFDARKAAKLSEAQQAQSVEESA